jgi:hypothetical protein
MYDTFHRSKCPLCEVRERIENMSAHNHFYEAGRAETGSKGHIGSPAVLAWGSDIPSNGATGYSKGCVFLDLGGTDQSNTLYCNIGDESSANFNAITVASD